MGFLELGQLGNILKDTQTIKASNIIGGLITAQELIIAGGTAGVVRSENYNGTSTGWAIFGDGSAKFFGTLTIGANAVVLGDIYSSAWNGTIPADLSSLDAGATAGYYLDSSVGSLQLEGDLFLQGDLNVGGNITMTSGGVFRTAASGARIEMAEGFVDRLKFFSGAAGEVANAQIIAGTNPSLDITGPTSTGGGAPANISLSANGADPGHILLVGQQLSSNGTAALPTYTFNGDPDTGFYRISADILGLATNGVVRNRWTTTHLGSNAAGFSATNTTVRWAASHGGQLQAVQAATVAAVFGRNNDGGVVDLRHNGTQVGTISVTGSATAYNTSSDASLKDNVRPFVNGLDLIRSLPVRQWEWKVDGEHGVGFVAQELNRLLPDITNEPDEPLDDDDEAWWSVDYGRLTPWNTRAIQELADQLDDALARLAKLENRGSLNA